MTTPTHDAASGGILDPLNKFHEQNAGSFRMVASLASNDHPPRIVMKTTLVYNAFMKSVSSCFSLLIALFILTPLAAFCQEKPRIVVLPFTGGSLVRLTWKPSRCSLRRIC